MMPSELEAVDYFPLSASQRRLWFLDRMEPGTGLYNVPALLRIRGDLNFEALEKSLKRIIDRHETLRTSFELIGDTPMQRITPELMATIPVMDVSSHSESEKAALELANLELLHTSFDLTSAPLFRAKLFRIAPGDHVLAFVMHHIACDGWSISVLIRELSVFYADVIRGSGFSLRDLDIQYADWAAWEEERLEGPLLRDQLSYWERQLAGAPANLDLPVDYPRQSAGMRATSYSCNLDGYHYDLLRKLTEKQATTLFVPLLTCFQVLLAYYSGQKDVVIGTPVANRKRSETENLIGCFINTLVLRTDLSGDPTLEEALLRTKRTVLEAFDNQDVPIEKIVEVLHPQRTAERMPLFQVMFTVQNMPNGNVQMPGLSVEFLQPEHSTVRHDMLVSATPESGRLVLTAEYRSELFCVQTIARMMRHYRRVLEVLGTAPDFRLSEICFLTSEEKQEAAVRWNETEANYPEQENIATLFEKQAARTPERLAIRYEEQTLTYAELDRRSNRLARYLKSQGIGSEQIVGVFLERDVNLVMVLLAAWKAGAAYLPLDPEYPQARLAQILNEAQVHFIISTQDLAKSLPVVEAQVIRMDADVTANEIGAQSDCGLQGPVTGESLAYVIYTSGSSGTPKGIMIAHRSILNRVWWAVETFPLTEGDAMLQKTPFSFDASIWEIFAPLLSGACLVIARPGGHRDPEYMISTIQREGITHLQLVPTMLNVLLREERFGDCKTLKRVFCGGEALAPDLVRRLKALLPSAPLQNLYGPTEASIDVSTYSCNSAAAENIVPIGKPIANTSIYILDVNLNLVAVGVPGEICVSGPGLARGYLNFPALTAQRFIPNPYARKGGERLYKTGDLGRRRNDGSIEYLGRLDNQVKVRGFRIELDEIDSILCSLAGIKQSVTTVRDDVSSEPCLVSYVVLQSDGGPSLGLLEIKNFLRTRLPEHMIPAVITEIESIPRTQSGKVDRRALPSCHAGLQQRSVGLAPRTETERRMAELVAGLLQIESVGALDNFFDLGGHSLIATRLVARIREIFHVEMPLRVVFECATVELLSAYIDEQLGSSSNCDALPHRVIARQPEEQRQMLSFAQQRLWIIDRLEAVAGAYNLLFAIRLTGKLDTNALSRALNEVVRRHEVLRTRFELGDDVGAVAIVTPELQIEIPTLSIDGPADEQQAQIDAFIADQMRQPFDLAQGPLLRAQLLHLDEEQHIAVFSLHHMVSDAWSLNLFISEISQLYRAYVDKSPALVPELPIQYGDYAAWQRHWIEGEVLNRQIAYWKDQLQGMRTSLNLPLDFPRPAVQTYRGSEVRFVVDSDLQKKLKRLAGEENATLFMLLLAALQMLLSRYAGQNDIAVGTPILSRSHPETENLIGLFSNTVVIRSQLDPEESFRHFLARVRETALSAYANQDAPFERVVEALKRGRNTSRSALFQVLFTLQNLPRAVMNLPGIDLSTVSVPGRASKFDLAFFLEEDGAHGIPGFIEYNTDLFRHETIERITKHWLELLHSIVANSTSKIGELNIVSASERTSVLEKWNCGFALDDTSNFASLFERQAAATPSQTAVVCDGQPMTYDELNRRSNQLANYLREAGADAETLIGVCLRRGLPMLVALIGTLKAGAAYVPLDPDYPEERIRYMVEDANVGFLLTQKSVLDAIPSLDKPGTVCLDRDFASVTARSESNPKRTVYAGNSAYVIYTSGSTGRPKGVVVSQGNLNYFMSAIAARIDIGPEDVFLASTTICFDISVYELLVPLTRGARVVIRIGGSEDGGVAQDIARYGVTAVQGTPSFWRMFCEGLSVRPKIKILCGGEALSPDLATTLLSLGCDVTNLYGPTESTIWSATYSLKQTSTNIPVGHPLENTTIHVLDAFGGLSSVGVRGELFIGGPGLARGYLNRPELTAERYVPNPYSRNPGERIYRTGDLGQYLPDGNLEYLGRLDQQVKIRGYRIELGEVEAALRAYPGVAEAVVLARDYGAGDKRLIAYVVWQPETVAGSGNDIREKLRSRLPEYLVPSIVMTLDKLPLTYNGKLNRAALPEPEQTSAFEYVAPRTEVEHVLARIWMDVLKVERLGIYNDFFALGGHSLLITQLASRIKQIFRLDVPLPVLFSSPTIADLAGALRTFEPAPGRLDKIAHIALQVFDADELEAVETLSGSQ